MGAIFSFLTHSNLPHNDVDSSFSPPFSSVLCCLLYNVFVLVMLEGVPSFFFGFSDLMAISSRSQIFFLWQSSNSFSEEKRPSSPFLVSGSFFLLLKWSGLNAFSDSPGKVMLYILRRRCRHTSFGIVLWK